MSRVAVVIYTHVEADTSRVYRALGTAGEFQEAGDDVAVVFDGAGVETLAAVSDPEHKLRGMLDAVAAQVQGACGFCARSHEVADQLATGGWTLLEDHRGHASIKSLVDSGYQVLNY